MFNLIPSDYPLGQLSALYKLKLNIDFVDYVTILLKREFNDLGLKSVCKQQLLRRNTVFARA